MTPSAGSVSRFAGAAMRLRSPAVPRPKAARQRRLLRHERLRLRQRVQLQLPTTRAAASATGAAGASTGTAAGAGKLALFHALIDNHSQIAAGGVDDGGQALRRRLNQEEELREELFLARQGGEALISSTVMTLPSTMPSLKVNSAWSLTQVERALASATGSPEV